MTTKAVGRPWLEVMGLSMPRGKTIELSLVHNGGLLINQLLEKRRKVFASAQSRE